jgi:hypothetical protein
MLHLPPITRSWLFSPNNRIVFVSLNDTMARLLFGLKNFLVATAGYTVKYTCNGVTGPTSSVDHTDRWLTFANVTTRATIAGATQSFAVLTDGNGCDLLLTYQGGSDDVARISFSPGGLFTPAGTSNQQPTATDEQVMVSGTTLINATATFDRVWHVMATRDKKLFRFFVYRAGTMTYSWGLEFCNTLGVLAQSSMFSPPVVGWATSNSTITVASTGSVVGGSNPGSNGGIAKISGISGVAVGGCSEGYLNSFANPFTCDLQGGGAIIVPVGFASNTAGASGKIGNRIDCWYGFWNALPTQGDALGDLTHVFMGTGIYPWDGVSYPAVA